MFRLSEQGAVVAAAVGLLISRSAQVWAQADSAGAPAPDHRTASTRTAAADSERARARAHFVLGMQLFETRAFRDALREFELAAELAPDADLWFNIGRAHEELGEYEQAARSLDRYLHDRVDAQDAARVRAHVAELERLARLATDTRQGSPGGPQAGSLRIHVRPEQGQALVLLDGQALSRHAIGRPMLLAPGRHRLDVSQEQYVPLHARFDIQSGLLTAAYADLRPATQTRMREPSRVVSWSLFALSAAAALTSATLGTAALAAQAHGRAREAEIWGERTDVALASTAVCALAAAVIYYVEGRSAPTEVQRVGSAR